MHAIDLRRGDRVRNHVDETTNGIRPIEQRRGTADDLDLRGAGRVDDHSVIARLTRQVADPLAVIEDQHAIAIESTDDGTRWARAERPLGDAWLCGDCRAQRTLQLFRQILAGEHGRRLIGIELIPRVGADRDDFAVVQLGIDRDVQGQRRLRDVELGSRWNEALGRYQQMVRAGGHVGNRVGAVWPRRGLERGAFDCDCCTRDRF